MQKACIIAFGEKEDKGAFFQRGTYEYIDTKQPVDDFAKTFLITFSFSLSIFVIIIAGQWIKVYYHEIYFYCLLKFSHLFF